MLHFHSENNVIIYQARQRGTRFIDGDMTGTEDTQLPRCPPFPSPTRHMFLGHSSPHIRIHHFPPQPSRPSAETTAKRTMPQGGTVRKFEPRPPDSILHMGCQVMTLRQAKPSPTSSILNIKFYWESLHPLSVHCSYLGLSQSRAEQT